MANHDTDLTEAVNTGCQIIRIEYVVVRNPFEVLALAEVELLL